MLTEGKPHGGKEPYLKRKIIVIFPGRTRLLRMLLDIGDLTDPNTGFNKSRVRECPTPSFHSYFTMFACQFRSAVFSSSGSWALLQNLVIKGIPRIIASIWCASGRRPLHNQAQGLSQFRKSVQSVIDVQTSSLLGTSILAMYFGRHRMFSLSPAHRPFWPTSGHTNR